MQWPAGDASADAVTGPEAGPTDSGTAPDVPVAPLSGTGIAIAPHSLPDAIVGLPYTWPLQSPGASSAAVWSIESGALPNGLSLAGTGPDISLQGSPSQAGSFSFVVKVTDGSRTGTWAFVLLVAAGPVVFVDPLLAQASCPSYEPAARTCGAGGATAYNTLAGAAAIAVAGTTVVLRAGTYAETLAPAHSGTQAEPIRFTRYGSEAPLISGETLAPAVELSDRSWIIVQGLAVDSVRRWMYGRRTTHCTLQNNTFTRALDPGGSSKTGLFFEEATYNRVRSNAIEDSTQDNLSLVKSDFNVIESNSFRKAAHTLWTIKCGNRNVLRGNYFHNELEKIGEVFDCDDVGFDHQFFLLDATKHNLVEGNDFAYTPSSGDHSPYAGIQYAGQQGIVRRNVFHDTVGPALDLTRYAEEARHCTDNRVYHNVFHATAFAGISVAGTEAAGYSFRDNRLYNNVLTGSSFVANDTRWPWYTGELAGKPVQVLLGGLQGFRFEGNNILGSAPGQPYAITLGQRDSSSNPIQHELAWWQSNHPDLFSRNQEVLPGFEDETARNFRLTAASALIDAGVFLTTTVAAGSGNLLVVEDSGWFFDGFGISGEQGDEVQLEHETEPARVVAVDSATHTLTVDRPLTWTAGQGVGLRFAGKAPDIGAFEGM